MKSNDDSLAADKRAILAALQHAIVSLDTFTYKEAASEEFLVWRAHVLDILTFLLGKDALAVFEWRVMRFAPDNVRGEEMMGQIWTTGQNYARALLFDVQRKQQA